MFPKTAFFKSICVWVDFFSFNSRQMQKGRTALMHAVEGDSKNHYHCARLILEAGADKDARNTVSAVIFARIGVSGVLFSKSMRNPFKHRYIDFLPSFILACLLIV
jgi:hypothetical protein